MADRLTGAPTEHWTGAVHSLTSLMRIDGIAYRVMGVEPHGIPPLEQTAIEARPTTTLSEFAGAEISVNTRDEPVVWSRFQLNGDEVLRVGSRRQGMLEKSGADLRSFQPYTQSTPVLALAAADAGVSE
jgi:hypothetical protein